MKKKYCEMIKGSNLKLPINSIREINPGNVIATGKDAIILHLPKRNRGEVLFDASKELYLQLRDILPPTFEGSWLFTSVDPKIVMIGPSEAHVESLQLQYAMFGYYNCLGREVLEVVEIEDITDPDEEQGVSYPKYSDKLGNHVWKSALWLPAKLHTKKGNIDYFMKLDTGAANVGVPSEVCNSNQFSFGNEKIVRGVTGDQYKRWIKNVPIEHEGIIVTIPQAFEHDKFLLGYGWFNHYNININWGKHPFVCSRRQE